MLIIAIAPVLSFVLGIMRGDPMFMVLVSGMLLGLMILVFAVKYFWNRLVVNLTVGSIAHGKHVFLMDDLEVLKDQVKDGENVIFSRRGLGNSSFEILLACFRQRNHN
jgi:hypothetical protein